MRTYTTSIVSLRTIFAMLAPRRSLSLSLSDDALDGITRRASSQRIKSAARAFFDITFLCSETNRTNHTNQGLMHCIREGEKESREIIDDSYHQSKQHRLHSALRASLFVFLFLTRTLSPISRLFIGFVSRINLRLSPIQLTLVLHPIDKLHALAGTSNSPVRTQSSEVNDDHRTLIRYVRHR